MHLTKEEIITSSCKGAARASKLSAIKSGTGHCNNMKRYLVINEDCTQAKLKFKLLMVN